MKRTVVLVVAIVMSVYSYCVMAQQTLTIYVADNIPPKMFVGGDRKVTGFLTELTEAIVQRAGYRPEIVAEPWVRAVKSAEEGKGVITGFSKNPEREKIFAFSDSFYEDKVLIVTLKKLGITANSLADLKGKKVGIQRGSSFGAAFEKDLPNVIEDRDNTTEQRIKKLAAERIDAAIITGGLASVAYNAKLAGVAMSDLTVQPTPLAVDQNYIGLANTRADRADVMKKLNAAIAAIKEDGTAKKIVAKWE